MADRETILIVDDWDVNIEMLEAILDSLGYETYSAMNVSDAIEIINDKMPHLILSDIMMPDISGYEFCEMLKSNPLTRDIPVIFVSAAESDEDREKAYNIGGVDFIRKPFDVTEIKTRVSTHLNIYNLRRELEDNNRKLNKVIADQSKRILEEKKRILKNIAKLSADNSNSTVNNEIVAKNSRLLAQALNFSDKYENKISESFVEAVEIGTLIRFIDIKIFEVFFTDNDKDDFVKTVADVVYNHDETKDAPLAARLVKVTDTFARLYSECDDREKVLSMMKSQDLDEYLLDMFLRIEKQMKA